MHRRLSPILLRYITCNFLLPFVCALLGFLVVFLAHNVFDEIPDFIAKGVPVRIIVLYFLALQPQNLTVVIPVSILLAASFMTLMMGRHNELTALRAAGLSLGCCAIPVWVISVLGAVAVFGIQESWGPACANWAANVEHQYITPHREKEVLAFSNPSEQRDWVVQKMGTDGTAENIILRQFDKQGDPLWLLSAKRGRYGKDGWVFQEGVFQPANVGNAVFFHERKMPELKESPAGIQSHSKNLEIATIRELGVLLNSGIINSPRMLQELRTMRWYRIFCPLAALVAALFGIALTISTDRVGLVKGFATALFLLVAFYVVGEFCLVLGKNGWIPAFCGGALSQIIFFAAGCVTMWRKQ